MLVVLIIVVVDVIVASISEIRMEYGSRKGRIRINILYYKNYICLQ